MSIHDAHCYMFECFGYGVIIGMLIVIIIVLGIVCFYLSEYLREVSK